MTELNREPFQHSLSESSLGNLALKWETPFLGPFPPRVSRKNIGLIHCVENGLVPEKGGPFPLQGIRRGRNKDTYAESSDLTSQKMQSTIQFRDPLSSQSIRPILGHIMIHWFHSCSTGAHCPTPFPSQTCRALSFLPIPKKPCWKLSHHFLSVLSKEWYG